MAKHGIIFGRQMNRFIFLFFLLVGFNSNAQNSSIDISTNNYELKLDRIPNPEKLSRFMKWSIFLGYHYNFSDNNNSRYHFIEAGLKRSVYTIPRLASLNIYVSSEFKVGNNQMIIGPKIGSYIQLIMFTFGLEAIYYTDTVNNMLRLSVNAVGIGTEFFKLSINPHITLYNTGIEAIGNGSFSITFDLLNLFKRETILK